MTQEEALAISKTNPEFIQKKLEPVFEAIKRAASVGETQVIVPYASFEHGGSEETYLGTLGFHVYFMLPLPSFPGENRMARLEGYKISWDKDYRPDSQKKAKRK